MDEMCIVLSDSKRHKPEFRLIIITRQVGITLNKILNYWQSCHVHRKRTGFRKGVTTKEIHHQIFGDEFLESTNNKE